MIEIFGVWMVLAHINYLQDYRGNCMMKFNHSHTFGPTIKDTSCDKVAEIINMKLREEKDK